MLTIRGTNITINRGDTAFITINVRDNEGQVYELQAGDKLWFAVKSKATDIDYAIAPKILNGNVLEIMTEDTINLAFGTYIYDIQLINNKGFVSTIIKPSSFIIDTSITGAGDR